MANDSEEFSDYLTATGELSIGGHKLRIQMSIPTKAVRPVELLPLFQSLADAIVGVAVKSVEDEGLTISCKKGCGACCNQLVPISSMEARRLGELINDMPEPRRLEIRKRFEKARGRFQRAGMLDRLLRPESLAGEEILAFGLEYFHQRIPCPFLDEEESCSIHLERPIACREYLVTSRAQDCAKPTAETVKLVKMPGQVSRAIRGVDALASTGPVAWIPMVLALDWAETHPDNAVPLPGPELVREVFAQLTGKDIGGPSA